MSKGLLHWLVLRHSFCLPRGDTELLPSDRVGLCRRITALEEVTLAALRDSRRNLIALEDMMKRLEGAIEREQKQFDRLHFSHKKAQSDAAYARTMEKLLAQERVKVAELRALQRQ